MDPLGSITCNRTSTNETYVNFPLLPNVDMYTVNYDEHLVSTDCLNKQFVTPNMRCKFMQQNESTEYSFSIRAISCNNQESQSSNFTLITGWFCLLIFTLCSHTILKCSCFSLHFLAISKPLAQYFCLPGNLLVSTYLFKL